MLASNNFTSYDSMFQTIYGAQSIGSKPAPVANDEKKKPSAAASDNAQTSKEPSEPKKKAPSQAA